MCMNIVQLRVFMNINLIKVIWLHICYLCLCLELNGRVSCSFACGRWLGRGVDDGSTERLLVGTPLQLKVEEDVSNTDSLTKRSQIRNLSPGPPRTEMKPSQIQHMLGTLFTFCMCAF